MNLFSIKNKVVIVTGSSSGIGKVLCKRFKESGAIVHGISRKKSNKYYQYNQHSCDITNQDEVKAIIKNIYKLNKKLNILINNAGVTFSETSLEKAYLRFDQTIEVNLKAAYLLSIICAKYMKKSNSCSIINMGSIGGLQGFPNNPSYLASKGGLISLTRGLAIDLAKKNIRVNSISPGYIYTKMTKRSYDNLSTRKLRNNRTINGRWGKVDDLVGTAIFLSSKSSEYINGQNIVVDGGWVAKGL